MRRALGAGRRVHLPQRFGQLYRNRRRHVAKKLRHLNGNYEAAIGNHPIGFCRSVLRFELGALTNLTVVSAELRLYRGYTDVGIWSNKPIRIFAVDSSGAALRDANHWSYAGLKTVTLGLVAITEQALGL